MDDEQTGNHVDERYLELVAKTLHEGVEKGDRTGTGTYSLFGPQLVFDLTKGFPLLTTKWVNFKAIKVELLWFLAGETNVEFLHEHDVHIWDEWADEDGDVGPVYGKQWREWDTKEPLHSKDTRVQTIKVDQINRVINNIRSNPHSRRHLVSAWNVSELGEMNLPPCHVMFQFYVRNLTPRERHDYWSNHKEDPRFELETGEVEEGVQAGEDGEYDIKRDMDARGVPKRALDCKLYQRSADSFLGVPFNIASYALLTNLVARVTDCIPGRFIHSFGDFHVYKNHVEQVEEQLDRRGDAYSLPRLVIDGPIDEIDDIEVDDIGLDGYDHHSAIRAPIAV